jgi:hypothetical protein
MLGRIFPNLDAASLSDGLSVCTREQSGAVRLASSSTTGNPGVPLAGDLPFLRESFYSGAARRVSGGVCSGSGFPSGTTSVGSTRLADAFASARSILGCELSAERGAWGLRGQAAPLPSSSSSFAATPRSEGDRRLRFQKEPQLRVSRWSRSCIDRKSALDDVGTGYAVDWHRGGAVVPLEENRFSRRSCSQCRR